MGWIISFTIIQSLSTGIDSWFVWLMYYLITLPIFVAHTYIFAYWFVPETFFKAKYFLFAIGAIVLLLVFSVIELVVSYNLVFNVFDNNLVLESGYLNFKNIVISGIGNQEPPGTEQKTGKRNSYVLKLKQNWKSIVISFSLKWF